MASIVIAIGLPPHRSAWSSKLRYKHLSPTAKGDKPPGLGVPLSGTVMNVLSALFGLTLLLIGLAPVAAAGPPNIWTHQCITDLESQEEICTTEILTLQDGVEFIVYFAHNPQGPAPLVVIGLEEKFIDFTITVDDKDPMTADQCDVGICYFDREKSVELLKQFKRGKKAHLKLIMDGAEIVLDQEITLRGFSVAFAKFALRR
jgi:hypothetical protein